MASGLQVRGIGGGDSLHMASDASVLHYEGMCRCGDFFAVRKAVSSLEHVSLRAVVGSEAGTSGAGSGVDLCVLAALVAVHAKRAVAGVGHISAVGQLHRGHAANQVCRGGRSRLAVRLMTGLAIDRPEGRVHGFRALDTSHKPVAGMAADTRFSAGAGSIARGDRMHGGVPFRALDMVSGRIMALGACSGPGGD